MSSAKNSNSRNSRYAAPVLVACKSGTVSNQVRMALKTIGYGKLTTVSTHALALDRMRERNFAFVIFDAQTTDMAAADFVRAACAMETSPILIAVSNDPRIDDVFNLLRVGARSFLVLPFTAQVMEDVIDRAHEGAPFSDTVLQAPDRNAALAGVVLNNLYRVSVLMRQSREFESAAREVDRVKCNLMEAVELARMFCEGGDDAVLRERICDDCVGRASIAASRLGRTRMKLRKQRERLHGEDDEYDEDEDVDDEFEDNED